MENKDYRKLRMYIFASICIMILMLDFLITRSYIIHNPDSVEKVVLETTMFDESNPENFKPPVEEIYYKYSYHYGEGGYTYYYIGNDNSDYYKPIRDDDIEIVRSDGNTVYLEKGYKIYKKGLFSVTRNYKQLIVPRHIQITKR